MNTLTIVIANINLGGPLGLTLFLLFAAIVGFFTAYYFYRSKYAARINKLEAEKEGMERKTKGLQEANDKLNKRVKQLEEKK